jgi:hypothetical protein
MWPTVVGLRVLKAAEADLVRRAVRRMLDRLVDERLDPAASHAYGIDWFDPWDCDQRIWLLDEVTVALLTPAPLPPAAAIWEAAVDTIFMSVIESIAVETEQAHRSMGEPSWRESTREAFRSQHGRLPDVPSDENDLGCWRIVVTQIADMILGARTYPKVELFRDGNPQHARRFLMQRGLPMDFLERIPPLRSDSQTTASIRRLRSILGE